MIVQNNHTPWVILILIVLGMAVLLGLLLAGTELFNPTEAKLDAQIRATQAAIEAQKSGNHHPSQTTIEQPSQAAPAPKYQVALPVVMSTKPSDTPGSQAGAIPPQPGQTGQPGSDNLSELVGWVVVTIVMTALSTSVVVLMIYAGRIREREAQAEVYWAARYALEAQVSLQNRSDQLRQAPQLPPLGSSGNPNHQPREVQLPAEWLELERIGEERGRRRP